jgi:hypothetical protein
MMMPSTTNRKVIVLPMSVSYAELPEPSSVLGPFPAAGAGAANDELELFFGSAAVGALVPAAPASVPSASGVVGACDVDGPSGADSVSGLSVVSASGGKLCATVKVSGFHKYENTQLACMQGPESSASRLHEKFNY